MKNNTLPGHVAFMILLLIITYTCPAQSSVMASEYFSLANGKKISITRCYPGGLMRAYCVSFDDGTLGSDWPVIAALRKRGIPATFFINSQHQQCKDALAFPRQYDGFEVASHGANHKGVSNLSLEESKREIENDQKVLAEKYTQVIDGFAYPYGDVPKTPQGRIAFDSMMKSLNIIYARGVGSTNTFMPPADFLRWVPDCGFMASFDKFMSLPVTDTLRVMMSFSHSIDFARGRLSFEEWERQLDRVNSDTTIWKQTMRMYARYILALRALRINSQGLHNDTDIPVFVKIGTKLVEVAPGKSVGWKFTGRLTSNQPDFLADRESALQKP